MSLPTRGTDRATALVIQITKSHRREPPLAERIHLTGRSAGETTEMQPMQGGAAARLQIRLIPHGGTIRPEGRGTQARHRFRSLGSKQVSAAHRLVALNLPHPASQQKLRRS
jgi:hypothetical protein